MATLTLNTDYDTIYVNYGNLDGLKLKTFMWNTGGNSSWNPFPVKLVRATMFVKYSGCPDTITYHSSTVTNHVLPTENGPVVNPGDEELSFALQVQLDGPDPDDDVVTIGAITTDPRGHDWFMVPLPPSARGKKWGKGGKPLLLRDLKDLDHKTLKRLEQLQKDVVDLEMQTRGKMK